MSRVDRVIWVCGLAALVVAVVYWPTLKTAYQNRQTIEAAGDVLAAWNGLVKGEVRS